MLIGTLFFMGAVLLTGYNIWISDRGERDSMRVAEEMRVILQEKEPDQTKEQDENDASSVPPKSEADIPIYERYPELPMPTMEIEGRTYIGILDVPALSLSLPIMNEWSESGLKIAPGRYDGSIYQKNLIIAGHNYRRHFSLVKRLDPGAEIRFTDADGNIFIYELMDKETIPGDRADLMFEGEWDLTLFTCDYGGRNRVAMRCRLLSSVPVE